MSTLTEDPKDPRLTHGSDAAPGPQAEVYLVLSEAEIAKGFVRPVRKAYVHKKCGAVTNLGSRLAETYAASPKFYGATFCVGCAMHLPVSEFLWDKTDLEVGS